MSARDGSKHASDDVSAVGIPLCQWERNSHGGLTPGWRRGDHRYRRGAPSALSRPRSSQVCTSSSGSLWHLPPQVRPMAMAMRDAGECPWYAGIADFKRIRVGDEHAQQKATAKELSVDREGISALHGGTGCSGRGGRQRRTVAAKDTSSRANCSRGSDPLRRCGAQPHEARVSGRSDARGSPARGHSGDQHHRLPQCHGCPQLDH
jgi:hypothetical protein